MKRARAQLTSLTLSLLLVGVAGISFSACSTREEATQRYVSSQVEGNKQKINLEEVQKAFWDTKGSDFNAWMTAFEKRVNEIYDGDDVVSIDATRKTGHLTITGYMDDKKEAGFQPGEEKLFSIEQTGDVTDNQLPYRVSGYDGQPYYQGHGSILGSPIVQMMVLSHLMGGWGGSYYTPHSRVVVLRDHRDSFRTSPSYSTQKTTNQAFHTRYKQSSSGGLASRNSFGTSSSTSSSSQNRGWSGFGKSSSSESRPSFGWGGRRSSSSSRGWGGRRR